MSVQLVYELWQLFKESIPYDDRERLADSMVALMLDYGFDIDDIRQEFEDIEVQDILEHYEDEEELSDDDDEDDEW